MSSNEVGGSLEGLIFTLRKRRSIFISECFSIKDAANNMLQLKVLFAMVSFVCSDSNQKLAVKLIFLLEMLESD